jgi:hypothetical protein
MRTLLLLICVLAATPVRANQNRPPTKPDGVYVSVRPVEGKAMVGNNLIDTVLMIEGMPMKQHVNVERLAEVFDLNVPALAVLAESHGGEVIVVVEVIRAGGQTLWKGVQGRQVVFDYRAREEPYVAVFPRR